MIITLGALSSILLAMVCPPIALLASLYGLKGDFRSWRVYILVIAFAMGVFAYCYEPTGVSSDLYRYFDFCRMIETQTYDEAVHTAQTARLFSADPLYTFVALCWGIAKIGDLRLLPAITAFVTYYISLYVTCSYGDALTKRKQDIFYYIVFLLFTISFFTIVNNVRNIIAFSLISLATFRELFQKKRNVLTYVLYIIAVYMHLSSLVLIAIRLLTPVARKIRYAALVACLAIPGLVISLSTVLNGVRTGNLIVNRVISLIHSGRNYYLNTTAEWAVVVSHSPSQMVYRVGYLSLVVIMVVLYLMWTHQQEHTSKRITHNQKRINSTPIDYSFLTGLIALACMPMTMPEYWRFAYISILYGGGVVVLLPEYQPKYSSIIRATMYCIGAFLFVWWVRDLFSYSDVFACFLRSIILNPISLMLLGMNGLTIVDVF